MSFTEKEILEEFDYAFYDKAGKYFPKGKQGDIKYNFFFDLEHGYFLTAGNRIHLYSDDKRWAVVFEKNGYSSKAFSFLIELNYFGNCVNYSIINYPETDYSYICNSIDIPLIEYSEMERISHNNFEAINNNIEYVNIRGNKVKIEYDKEKYKEVGINIEDNIIYYNEEIITYGNFIRYLNETNPEIIMAKENDLRKNIPSDIPKIMTIDNFHFKSIYNKEESPSQQETYKLIAKILVSKNKDLWKPYLKSNNHWSNWESGNL